LGLKAAKTGSDFSVSQMKKEYSFFKTKFFVKIKPFYPIPNPSLREGSHTHRHNESLDGSLSFGEGGERI
jgi:hypothetical protein